MTGEAEEAWISDKLKDLLAFIIGPGMGFLHTYPGGDENQQKIFAGCLELEGLGLIARKRDEGDYVLWAARPSPPTTERDEMDTDEVE